MTKQGDRNRIFLIALLTTGGVAAIAWLYSRRWNIAIEETELDVATTESSTNSGNGRNQTGEQPLQLLSAGEGPVYHRYYQIDIPHAQLSKEVLMQHIQQDINQFAPGEMAYFEKTKGNADELHVGDEFLIHITGPWNGPVRVIDVQPTSFTFITLEGHLEAGEIQFRVSDHPDQEGTLRFEIRSWARSSDTITDFFYRFLRISKVSQTRMWAFFCKRVAESTSRETAGKVSVMTHKMNYRPTAQAPTWKQYSNQFDRWGSAKFNFDPSKRQDFTEVNGWHIDDYQIGLPSEEPGAVIPNGSFAAAKDIMMNYKFPDPSLVTGIFMPDNPLKDRIMVIRARFMRITFLFGVRVSQVIDEQRDTGKRGMAQVWGYGYSTLAGHFEMGEITFQVFKYLNSGEVEFHIHAYSKKAYIPNLFYRIGFRIFGRSLQRRFANTSLERMQQLVIQQLAHPTPAGKLSDAKTLDTPEVKSVSADDAVRDKVGEIGHRTENALDSVKTA